MIVVNIARDFTRFPAGRYKRLGSTSGEEFRERFLEAPISKGEPVRVEFDGTLGYGSSFLDEAFGGLVHKLKINPEIVLSLLTLESSDPSICTEIKEYIQQAGNRK